MKHTLKKSLAIILAAAVLICSAPLTGLVGLELPKLSELFASKAKAIEASDLPEDFDLTLYNVSVLFDSNYGNGTSFKVFKDNVRDYSIAKSLYDVFEQNTAFILSVDAWEAIRLVSNPSNLAQYLKYQQQYEKVIFAVVFNALKNEKFEELSYSKTLSKITSLTKKIINSGKNAELLDKTSLDGTERKELIDTAFAFLTEGKDIDSKWSKIGKVSDVCNKFLKFTENVTSTVNIINSVTMYVSMLDAGAEVLAYLNALKAHSPNAAFGAAVQAVIDTISHDWLGVVERTIIDSGFVFGIPATKKLIDYAWTGCCAMCPFLGGMTIGENLGVLASNLFLSTEDAIEQYEYIKILTQLEAASNALLEQYGKSCSASVNSENSAELMFAVDFSYSLYCMGAEASVEMANIAYSKGIINAVGNFIGSFFDKGGKIKVEQYEEIVGVFLDSRKTEYYNVKCYWKYCIEDVFPEFFEILEEENITPKYIEEVNIEKDEVVFRVGDAIHFKWTLRPIDHEGGIGLKSDNEAVIKSSEPMGILPIALEENIGTANVTVYSIDNPEICDTIKITVIGENDEGTTEAEQNIVSGKCGDDLTWTLNKSTGRLIISGTGRMYDYDNSIVPWDRDKIKTLIMGDGVTSIGDSAFEYCRNLENVYIGNNVWGISSSAFSSCAKLETVTIPSKVNYIGNSSFIDCYGLTKLSISNGVSYIGESSFRNCSGLKCVDIPNSVLEIQSCAFRNCDGIERLSIGNGLRLIGMEAFYSCDNLASVTIPGNVKIIGGSAFKGCSGLKSVELKNGVDEIRGSAFEDCRNLMFISIPDSVTVIGRNALLNSGYYNDSSKWTDNVLYIGNCLISATQDIQGDCKVKIGTRIIADYSFFECENLTGVTLPDGVVLIGENAFSYCSKMKEINLPESIKSIGRFAFYDCSAITEITIPSGVESVGEHAFGECCSITEVYFNAINCSDNELWQWIFINCTSLSKVVFGDDVTAIPQQLFVNCKNLKSITIPSNVKYIGGNAFKGCGISTVNFNATCCDSMGSANLLVFEGCPVKNINIGENVTKIPPYAFYMCSWVESIQIPSNVQRIGECAFGQCTSLQQISIPESVTYYGKEAFLSCSNLRTVECHFGKKIIEFCDINTFKNCDSLTEIIVYTEGAISSEAFGGCEYVETVIIVGKLHTIYPDAFKNCKNLNDVYYTGTKEDFNKITVESGNNCFLNATIHYNYVFKDDYENDNNHTIKYPSTSTISYGDSIILHVDESKIPAGGRVEWTASNSNFSYKANGATCTISPAKSGDTTFTATIYDANGNPVSTDEQTMTSKAGFFDKIIAFFKGLFGLSKTYPNVFKGIL